MILTKEQLEELRPIIYGKSGETWPRTVVDMFDTISALESRLAAATEMGPCGKHPKMFWAETDPAEGVAPHCEICVREHLIAELNSSIAAAYERGKRDALDELNKCGLQDAFRGAAQLILALKDRGAKGYGE